MHTMGMMKLTHTRCVLYYIPTCVLSLCLSLLCPRCPVGWPWKLQPTGTIPDVAHFVGSGLGRVRIRSTWQFDGIE